MAYCKHCGAKIEESALYCKSCGKPVAGNYAVKVISEKVETDLNVKKKVYGTKFIVGTIALIIFFSITLGSMFTGNIKLFVVGVIVLMALFAIIYPGRVIILAGIILVVIGIFSLLQAGSLGSMTPPISISLLIFGLLLIVGGGYVSYKIDNKKTPIIEVPPKLSQKVEINKLEINKTDQTDLDSGDKAQKILPKGTNIYLDLEISFREAVLGCSKAIEVNRQILCERCKGLGYEVWSDMSIFGVRYKKIKCRRCQGKGFHMENSKVNVQIHGCAKDGQKIVLREMGNTAGYGSEYGNLIITLKVGPHPDLYISGFDLIYHLKVKEDQLSNGFTTQVPLIDGEIIDVEIPSGFLDPTIIKIAGKGCKIPRENRRGDMLVHISTKDSNLQ